MSDDAEKTKAELQMALNVCRERANNLLEHHKSIVRLLCIIFILTQVIQMAFFIRGVFAR